METFFIELEITGQLAMDQQQHLQRRMRVRQYILPLGVPLEPVVANQPYAVDYGALADPVDQWDNPQMGWRLLEHRLMEMEDFNDRLDNYVWWQRLLERLEPGNHLIGEGGVVLPVGQHNRQFALLVKRIYTVRLIDARTQFNYYLMLITRTFVRCANTLDSEMNDNSTEGPATGKSNLGQFGGDRSKFVACWFDLLPSAKSASARMHCQQWSHFGTYYALART